MPTDPDAEPPSAAEPQVAAPSEPAAEEDEPFTQPARQEHADNDAPEQVPRSDEPEAETALGTPLPAPMPMANPLSAPEPPTASLVTPSEPAGPGAVVGQVVFAAVQQVARAVRPEAAVAVATEFTFPLALALAVVGYLVIQGLVDRRDPKLHMAPQQAGETFMTFVTEEQL